MVLTIDTKVLPFDPDGLSQDIQKFVNDLQDIDKFNRIKKNPYRYLKDGSFPILFQYISNTHSTRNSFLSTMKRFLNGINVFNACSRCIVLVYLTIVALLGQVSGWIGIIHEIIDKIVNILRDFFGQAVLLGRHC